MNAITRLDRDNPAWPRYVITSTAAGWQIIDTQTHAAVGETYTPAKVYDCYREAVVLNGLYLPMEAAL